MSASKVWRAGLGAAAVALLAAAPAAAQGKGPVPGFTTHIVATHYLRGETYETHHYFKQLREGVLQGLVFRQGADGAPLIEVEWAVGKAVYDSLPDWQKMHWHPLAPAVAAGRVSLPDLSDAEEAKMLQTVRTLYAQTINLAGIEGELPTGIEGVGMATHMRWGEK